MKTVKQGAKSIVKLACLRVASLPLIPKIITGLNKIRYSKRTQRRLEIGPGNLRMPGFESLNIVPGAGVDYIADAAKKLPFSDNTFDLIYASHVLEHIPWFKTLEVLKEWVRIL